MSDIDDDVKDIKALQLKQILNKLDIIENTVNKMNSDKPKQINKTIGKDSEMYKNKRKV